uniref:Uncharacterized protein n=1 Tax=Panagrolaimus superbus TaxID=310955 RepID=A0A914Y0B1_9BILA
MFVKVVASSSPSKTKFQHQIQHNIPPSASSYSSSSGVPRSASGSFGGTPTTFDTTSKKRSVVSSSSQIKFTALAQMAEQRARAAAVAASGNNVTEDPKSEDNAKTELLPPPVTLQKSQSMTSLRAGVRRVKKNYLCVALFFLISGLACNGISYWISVQSAQLNAEVVDAAVANHENTKFSLKKAFVSGPSKYLIGLCSFLGRVTSAIGTFFLAQAVVTWLQRRRSNTLRSAAGHADEAVGEIHGGCTEIVADCWTNCIPAFG